MEVLKQVINVCLEKKYHFSINPEANLICISINAYETVLNSYYEGSLVNYTDEDTMPLNELLNKLNK